MTGRKYLLVKGRAGLGNRVFSLLTAILYARLTGRRLLVDWSDPAYSNDGSNVVHQFFVSKLFGPSDEIPDTDSVKPKIWSGCLRESAIAMQKTHTPRLTRDPFGWKRLSASLSRLDHEEEVLVMWTYFPLIDQLRRHFHGEFGGLRQLETETIVRRLMRESLALHPAIQERVNGLRTNWPAKPIVGVHVRHMDKRTSLQAIRRRVNQLRAQNPGASVFLATDNQNVEESFARAYPGLLTAPKWYPNSGGKALHEHVACPDRAANGVEALTDLYLLAGCDHLVLDTSSSFSHLASVLADTERSRICDVNRWRILPPRIRHLLWRTRQSVKWGPRRFLTDLQK
jgi:hypothetical protein